MKTQTEKPAITVTTKVRLTLRGQTFDMTMAELKDLYERIGKVEGVIPPVPTIVVEPKDRIRPFYPPQWHRDVVPPPSSPPYEITCAAETPPMNRLMGGYAF